MININNFDPNLADCGSHSCYFKSDKDRQQRTNSGCKCLSHLPIDEQIAIRKNFKKGATKMTMETLENIKELAGYDVVEFSEIEPISLICEDKFIFINHATRQITFQMQSDPVSLVGVNGCQYPAMIEAAKIIIERLNKILPCDENIKAINHLNEALAWIDRRTSDRISRNVEGKQEA